MKPTDSPQRPLARVLASSVAPGLMLLAAAAIALGIANSALGPGFDHLLHTKLPFTPIGALTTAHAWINDALMAVFFFAVGLEIKREVLDGALTDPAARRLPILSAIAGMALPAIIFILTVGRTSPLSQGWAIPAATDIAFAVGILALLGRRIPPALRVFLLTVAIVDDIGAVVIIALFFTSTIDPTWLFAAAAIVTAMLIAGWRGARRLWIYLAMSGALWFAVLHAGIHPTVAAVVAAMLVPFGTRDGSDSPVLTLEHAISPWTAFVVVPLFALANAGVTITAPIPTITLPIAIGLGLFIGKTVGVFGAAMLAQGLGIAPLPVGVTRAQMAGVAMLCGIGFTMSLFISGLAFASQPVLIEEAKIGILGGSLVSALAGYLWLRLSCRPSKTD